MARGNLWILLDSSVLARILTTVYYRLRFETYPPALLPQPRMTHIVLCVELLKRLHTVYISGYRWYLSPNPGVGLGVQLLRFKFC